MQRTERLGAFYRARVEEVGVLATIDEFVATRGHALLRFAFMLAGDRHGAEDLVQGVLVRAYPRWSRIVTVDQPEAYLKKMIVNEHLRWRRQRSSSEIPVAIPEDTRRPGSASDTAAAHAARDTAWALLARLPRRQRCVLVLRYYEDLADAEIAAILRCRESTVRSQAARGLAALRAIVPHLERELLP